MPGLAAASVPLPGWVSRAWVTASGNKVGGLAAAFQLRTQPRVMARGEVSA
jgi:hypothetical protein